MVNAISSFDATNYLSQIKGATPITASATVAPTPVAAASSPATSATKSTASATGSNPLGLSPDVLALLQGTGSSSNSTDIGALLGNSSSSSSSTSSIYDLLSNSSSSSSSDALSGLYDQLLKSKSTTEPLQQAVASSTQAQSSEKAAASDSIQNLLNTYNQGFNAYNKTLQQNATTLIAQTAQSLIS